MGLRPKKSAAGGAAEQAALEEQGRASATTERERISLLSEQLGDETRTRAKRFGTRSLLAGTGGSTPLGALVGGGGSAGGKSGLVGSLFGGLAGLFGR